MREYSELKNVCMRRERQCAGDCRRAFRVPEPDGVPREPIARRSRMTMFPLRAQCSKSPSTSWIDETDRIHYPCHACHLGNDRFRKVTLLVRVNLARQKYNMVQRLHADRIGTL